MKRTLVCLIGCALLLPSLLVATAAAQEPSFEDLERRVWQQRYRGLLQQVEQAQLDLETARAAYNKRRQRERLRGEHRKQAVAAIEEAEARLDGVQEQLEELPDEARKAGIPPGWLRAVED